MRRKQKLLSIISMLREEINLTPPNTDFIAKLNKGGPYEPQ